MTQEHPDEFDSPWKEALEQALPDFLALFFPEAHAGIDWRRGHRFRDKELQQVVRDAEVGSVGANRCRATAGRLGWVAGSRDAIARRRCLLSRQIPLDPFSVVCFCFRYGSCMPR